MSGAGAKLGPGIGLTTDTVYLSSIGHHHGERRELVELARTVPLDESLCADGLAAYRVSGSEIWELAAAAAEQALARSDAVPDIMLYVSENDTQTVDSLARLLDHLGLPETRYLAVSGHDCGNLAPALATARDMIVAGTGERVLLVLADRARSPRHRVMASKLSVFSDGAASCLVTQNPPEGSGPRFRVDAIGMRSRVRVDGAGSADAALLTTVELAREGATEVLRNAGCNRDVYEHVMFSNYRLNSQRFLAVAMGFQPEALLLGSVAELAHCFSADILVTLRERYADGTLGSGRRLLASSTGPHSWSTIALEAL